MGSQAFEAVLNDTPDPRCRVPSGAFSRATNGVLRAVGEGLPASVVIGPTGCGKTLLLRTLSELFFAEARYVPFLSFPPEDLEKWLATHLPKSPESAPATVLLIDELQGAPEATAQRLGELVRRSGGQIQAVVAGSPAGQWDTVIGAFRRGLQAPVALPEFRLEHVRREEFDDWLRGLRTSPRFGPAQRARLAQIDDTQLWQKGGGVPRVFKAELLGQLRKLEAGRTTDAGPPALPKRVAGADEQRPIAVLGRASVGVPPPADFLC